MFVSAIADTSIAQTQRNSHKKARSAQKISWILCLLVAIAA